MISNRKSVSFKWLLEQSINLEIPNIRGYTPFLETICCGELSMMEELIKKERMFLPKIGRGMNTLMLLISRCNSDDCLDKVEQLIQLGIPIDEQRLNGQTALHMAVIRNQAETIRFLLKAGARTNIKDETGKTFFELAFLPSNSPNDFHYRTEPASPFTRKKPSTEH